MGAKRLRKLVVDLLYAAAGHWLPRIPGQAPGIESEIPAPGIEHVADTHETRSKSMFYNGRGAGGTRSEQFVEESLGATPASRTNSIYRIRRVLFTFSTRGNFQPLSRFFCFGQRPMPGRRRRNIYIDRGGVVPKQSFMSGYHHRRRCHHLHIMHTMHSY